MYTINLHSKTPYFKPFIIEHFQKMLYLCKLKLRGSFAGYYNFFQKKRLFSPRFRDERKKKISQDFL